jgi:hypothetical protein
MAAHGLSCPGCSGGFVLLKWKVIKELPGIEPLTKRLKRKPIPIARAGRLTIAVAHLEDSKDQEQEKLLLDELTQFEGG